MRRDSPGHAPEDFDSQAPVPRSRPAPLRPPGHAPCGRDLSQLSFCLVVVGASRANRARRHHGSSAPQRLQGERVTGRDPDSRPYAVGRRARACWSPPALPTDLRPLTPAGVALWTCFALGQGAQTLPFVINPSRIRCQNSALAEGSTSRKL